MDKIKVLKKDLPELKLALQGLYQFGHFDGRFWTPDNDEDTTTPTVKRWIKSYIQVLNQ